VHVQTQTGRLSKSSQQNKQTLSAGELIADMLLSSLVQCVQELVKLIVGLATEHRQQLHVLSERRHFRANGLSLFVVEDLGLIKFTDESGMFGIQTVYQEHVTLLDDWRVIKVFSWTYVSVTNLSTATSMSIVCSKIIINM